ncbi:MAG TPA: tetratricopeptide repeat protein [Desulfobacterales bacterium]|nr:tetratricopeptide repeat protein [Desulfobacterales bacterium]
MKKVILICLLFLLLLPALNVFSASYQKAEMFNRHGLVRESKAELINIIFSNASITEKAQAYYLLGLIAYTEKKVNKALKSWRELVTKYPETKEAKLVKDRVKELAEIVGGIEKEPIKNAVAQLYLNHGDFWSKGTGYKLTIDTSLMPHVEAAVKWYDKVIQEFPNSSASRIAYKGKMRTLLGWKKHGNSYGIRQSFSKYMPQLLETFNQFEIEYPNASTLQAFRYQIAQAYWDNKNWNKSREWLNLIIKKAGDRDSFYKDSAMRRLKWFKKSKVSDEGNQMR